MYSRPPGENAEPDLVLSVRETPDMMDGAFLFMFVSQCSYHAPGGMNVEQYSTVPSSPLSGYFVSSFVVMFCVGFCVCVCLVSSSFISEFQNTCPR